MQSDGKKTSMSSCAELCNFQHKIRHAETVETWEPTFQTLVNSETPLAKILREQSQILTMNHLGRSACQ